VSMYCTWVCKWRRFTKVNWFYKEIGRVSRRKSYLGILYPNVTRNQCPSWKLDSSLRFKGS